MMLRAPASPDSQPGGAIPGIEGAPAFRLSGGAASPVPVLIAVPHAGRTYPPALLAAMRDPEFSAPRLEDRLVDLLAAQVARATGAALLLAEAPRAMLDLNRAADDVDWEMVRNGGGPRPPTSPPPGRRVRGGLGLVPRRLPELGEIWKERLDPLELEARIDGIHAPYHATVATVLADLRARWGAALLLDFHSMPPLPARPGGVPAADFVIGDRFGTSCDGALVGAAFAHFAQAGRRAAHNRPYAGGYALERHARPRQGVHALQLEVDRRCYLESTLRKPGERIGETAELLARLVRRLAEDVALLGGERAGEWAVAAE
jgi:N-formylglutamate amidohydrolase